MITIPLKTISRPIVIYHTNDGKRNKYIIMAPITEEQEKAIDNKKNITIPIRNRTIEVLPSMISCYGEIDMTKNSDDYIFIKRKFSPLNETTVIPGSYNYDNHSCTCENGNPYRNETYKAEKVVQFYHGLLGKPKRCVIFKRII